MTRQIKFRAWDEVRKKMFSPSSISWKNNTVWVCDSYGDNRGEYELEQPNSWLMQFTGLKDKNGKEIYEGDIFDCIYLRDGCKEHKMVVVWHNSGAFKLGSKGKMCQQSGVTQTMFDATRHEIIGNIYENPELLKLLK